MSDPANPGVPAALPATAPQESAPQAAPPVLRARRGRPVLDDETTRLGRIIQIRIDKVLQDALSTYMVTNNMTISQATRVLLTIGLNAETANPDGVFHAAAFREGVLQGLGTVKEKIGSAINKALKEIGSEIEGSPDA